MLVEIGGVCLEVSIAAGATEPLDELYSAFRVAALKAPSVRLEVDLAAPLSPLMQLGHSAPPALALRLQGDRIAVGGTLRGELDPQGRCGHVAGVRHVGEIDALVRLALACVLPFDGGLLVHGTAVTSGEGMAVLMGRSGAGKSTAAAHLRPSLSDDLVVLRPHAGGVTVEGTPYWGGRPGAHAVSRLVCLRRGESPRQQALEGSTALRALHPHVVRYLAHPRVDVDTLALLARVARAGVLELACPEGPAYLPFLSRALGAAVSP
jgi:hypothetical protein